MKKNKTTKGVSFRLKMLLTILVLEIVGGLAYLNYDIEDPIYIAPVNTVKEVVKRDDSSSKTNKEIEEAKRAIQQEQEELMQELDELDVDIANLTSQYEKDKSVIENKKQDVLDRLSELDQISFMREESSPERNSN